jgi:hypothetical protein
LTEERYLFLGGHRKSGTTMLLNLFDGHPGCCVYPTDISVLYGYFPVWTAEGHSTDERLARLDLVVFGTLRKVRLRHGLHDRLPVEAMREHFFGRLDNGRLDEVDVVIRQIIDSYRAVTRQPVSERPVVVIKETSLEIYARELAGLFPGARFVQLVRDPRDNMGALRAGAQKRYKQIGESEPQILASLIHRAGLGLRLIDDNRRALGEDHFQTVLFERLTEDPAAVLDSMCAFTGLEHSPGMPTPTVMGVSTIGNNYDGEAFRNVTARNVGRWRDRISLFEAQVIEFHLGELMEQHEYRRELDPGECARAAAEFYKWMNYQYFFKDAFPRLAGKSG